MIWRARATTLLLCASLAGAFGCDARAAHASTPPSAKAAEPVARPSGGEIIAVSAGSVRAGSLPGSAGRNPTLEADMVAVELGAFEIDRRPFPNDAAAPSLTGIDQTAASAACAKTGKRLCSELEWESACDSAADFLAPISEWTASPANGTNAIVRGTGSASAGSQRCATRTDADATSVAEDRGFRCCKGEPQTASYPVPALDDAPIASLTPSQDEVRAALAGATAPAALKALAKDFTLFGDGDVSAALRRGKRSRENVTAQTILGASFAWSPAAGEQLHVITGRAGSEVALVVLYPLGGGGYAHAASAILREPEATFALGYREGTRDQLSWTTCYGCPSEGGALRYANGRVTIDFH